MSTNDFDVNSAATYDVVERIKDTAHVSGMEAYESKYAESMDTEWWATVAREELSWFQDFDQTQQGTFEEGDLAWFAGGKLNVCYNCVDRHVKEHGDQVAILWEGNEAGDNREITYAELQREVCRVANVLKSAGVGKGDTVAIYMPMVPEAAYTMLACARLGAPHSVVFAGFSARALADRLNDAKCKVLVTANEGLRGPKSIALKEIVDEALADAPTVESVFVLQRTETQVPMEEGRDYNLLEEMAKQRPYCPCEWLDSEDTLFLLYTSGSTGTPKGLVHTQAGYLLYTMLTHKYVFDYKPGDIYACVADIGWITGHSYIVYGPLGNRATTVMFESVPTYPDASRYWDMVERLNITSFYTAPTAIRALMKYGDEPVKKHSLSSLRVLGTVGEPINPPAWEWYYNVVGNRTCSIVDTWWQTETGGHVLTPLPGATPLKAGSATLPFFGQEPKLLDGQTGEEIQGPGKGVLVLARPWPSLARTVYGNHQRYLDVYMRPYPGYYFTGDGATRDNDGYLWITGRVDDVLNVSGHRLGSGEIENALAAVDGIAEAAVVGIPHEVKGQALFAYCVLKEGVEESEGLVKALVNSVKSNLGSFCKPDVILIVHGLPKTRSGKLMRRILRKLANREGDKLGDISTIADPSVLDTLQELVPKKLDEAGF